VNRIDSRDIAIVTDSQRQELARLIEEMLASQDAMLRLYARAIREELIPGGLDDV
jgi:phage regulator Rha-like protein